MSRDMTKPTKWLCTQQRLWSAWASAQTDQSLRCVLNWQLRTQAFFMRTAKTLIRLGGCPGWSESSSAGCTVILFVLSCRGSNRFTASVVVKFLKFWTSEKIAVITLKLEQSGFTCRVMHRKVAGGIANGVDPDQTAPLGAVWSGSGLFAQTYLSKNLGSLR